MELPVNDKAQLFTFPKLQKTLAIAVVSAVLSLCLSGCSSSASKEVAAQAFMDAICPYNVFLDKNKTVKQTVKSFKKYYRNASEKTAIAWDGLSSTEINWPMSIRGEIQLLAEDYKALTLVLEQTQSVTKLRQFEKLDWPELRSASESEAGAEKIKSTLGLESDLMTACNEYLGVANPKPKQDKKEPGDKPKKTKAPEPEIDYVEMPNIVGAIDGEAKRWLFQNGYKFVFDVKSTGFNPKISCLMSGRNLVLEQRPAAGTQVVNGFSTRLTAVVQCEG